LTEHLAFLLGSEVFSPEISMVREVLYYTVITRVSRMPENLQGVINLRGSVVRSWTCGSSSGCLRLT
jgi:chemotaxis signal transduction protein